MKHLWRGGTPPWRATVHPAAKNDKQGKERGYPNQVRAAGEYYSKPTSKQVQLVRKNRNRRATANRGGKTLEQGLLLRMTGEKKRGTGKSKGGGNSRRIPKSRTMGEGTGARDFSRGSF